MTNHLPNLSALTLQYCVDPDGVRLEEADVGAFAADPPVGTVSAKEYEQAMFGVDVITRVSQSIENGEVIASFKSQPMYQTLTGGQDFPTRSFWFGWQRTVENLYQRLTGVQAFHTRRWWFDWQRTAEKTLLSQGTWNEAWLVTGNALPPAAFFVYNGLKVPANGMIIRIGKPVTGGQAPTKETVIREMITGAYAHANGFGPVIYAQFYYGLEEYEEVGGSARRTLDPHQVTDGTPKSLISLEIKKKKKKQVGQVGFTCAVAEAWEGDCVSKMSRPDGTDQFTAKVFADEFIRVCMRAAEAGFWHMDIKRANMLYRYRNDSTDSLELCFTDFDSYFCRILSPRLRTETRSCCIAATAACMLGEIRCQASQETWERYAQEVKRSMERIAGVDLNRIRDNQWCFFLKNIGVGAKRKKHSQEDDRLEVADPSFAVIMGDRFRNHIWNYFNEGPGSCFKIELDKPLFPQIVEFATGPNTGTPLALGKT